MVVIARSLRLLFFVALTALVVCAADAPDIRAALGQVPSALTANDPSSAMEPFSRSFVNYDKLRDYFTGLTDAFSITNEVDVLEQQDSPAASQATVRWSMTVASNGSNHTTQRSAEIRLRMARERKKWKIVYFSPISLFDPSQAQTPSSK